MLDIACHLSMTLIQMNVKSAFLNGVVGKEVPYHSRTPSNHPIIFYSVTAKAPTNFFFFVTVTVNHLADIHCKSPQKTASKLLKFDVTNRRRRETSTYNSPSASYNIDG